MKQTAVAQGAISNPISRWALENRLTVSFEMVPKNANSLLDLGCGEGHFLAILERSFPSMMLVGVDLSEENIRYARRILKRARLVTGDATRVNLPASSFDVVSALELLDHVNSDRALLLKVRSLLKPKGVLIVSTPDSNMLLWKLIWRVWTLTLGKRWRAKHLRRYTENELLKLLERSGFRVKRKTRAILGCVMILACEKSR
jgi:2-polyprenyl-3-methyl-5-hydroxy-6-metoxy-1,4-benzoquinol methylase